MPTPDFATLHWCSIVTSMTFTGLFAFGWLVRGRARHLAFAGAAYLVYAIALAGLAVLKSGVLSHTLLCGLLGLSTLLTLLAVRAFDGTAMLDAAALAIPAATAGGYLIPALLPASLFGLAPHAGAQIVNSVMLAGTTLLAAWLIGRRHHTHAPRAQMTIAAALLGYLPGYAVSITLALRGGDASLLALLPMFSDQVLLPMLGLGLLGMAPERDARALRLAALRDPLTGAWNRAGLARLERRRDGDSVVVLIDVDRFKAINDRHGHAAGDAVLVALAAGAGAAAGTELVRLGGDEFVAVCGSPAEARRLADAVLALGVASLPRWSVSIGIAQREAGETGLAPAIARADALLYRAKAAGRGCLAAA